MQITVSGKGVETGDALSTHARNRLEDGLGKYMDRMEAVEVVVSREAHQFTVHIHSNVGTASNFTISSHAKAEDVYAAFDSAADKVEKQLRRYKRRLKDHHKSAKGDDLSAVKYIIQSAEYMPDAGDEPEAQEDQPVIIAENPGYISRLTVSEAVMRMDLGDLPALMFYNSSSGRLNVVYRRQDGNISWVDPAEAKAA